MLQRSQVTPTAPQTLVGLQPSTGVRASVPLASGEAPCLAWQAVDMKYLVVDSGPLIKGVRLERFGAERYVTVPEVLGELRDSQARALLESLPFDLELREPSDEAMKAGALRSPVIAPVVHGPIALLISAPMTWRWQ